YLRGEPGPAAAEVVVDVDGRHQRLLDDGGLRNHHRLRLPVAELQFADVAGRLEGAIGPGDREVGEGRDDGRRQHQQDALSHRGDSADGPGTPATGEMLIRPAAGVQGNPGPAQWGGDVARESRDGRWRIAACGVAARWRGGR